MLLRKVINSSVRFCQIGTKRDVSCFFREFCRNVSVGVTNVPGVLQSCISNVDTHLHERIMPLLEERAVIKVKIAGVRNVTSQNMPKRQNRVSSLLLFSWFLTEPLFQTKNSYEAYQAYPEELHRLGDIEDQIKVRDVIC